VTRAFPVSLFFHLLALTLVIWFGSHVGRQVMPRQRTISVRMARLPQPQTRPVEPVEQDTPAEEPEPEPVVQTEPDRPPAVVPEEPAREIVAEEPVEEPEPVRQDPVRSEDDAPTVTETEPASPRPVMGTDVVVPARFKYYIDLLESRIARNWHPRQLGFRESAARVCQIHFHVEQNGLITRETIVRSSGVPLMDRESLKAVRSVGHFMPLPRGLADNALGVTYTFTLTSGN